MTKDNYLVALLEEMNGKFDLMMEVIVTMNDSLEQKADKSDIVSLKEEVLLNRTAIKETNSEIRGPNFKPGVSDARKSLGLR